MELYDEDLAFIQAAGFGELAAAAIATLIPLLKARGARRVIDVGCGAGVSTRALLQAGLETLAIEPSEAMLRLARAAAPGARFQRASAYDASLERCDAILAIGEVLTYHAPEDDAEAQLQGFFGRAHRALSDGGTLVFDLIEASGALLNARNWKAGPDWAVLSASEEDPQSGRLTRTIETFREMGGGAYRRRREAHHVRLFDRNLVSAWLERTGFEVETASAYGPIALPARRVVFYARRPQP